MVMDIILTAFASPMRLADYPNNIQTVQREVRVMTEVSSKRVGYEAHHCLILQLDESRKQILQFNN